MTMDFGDVLVVLLCAAAVAGIGVLMWKGRVADRQALANKNTGGKR